MLSQAAELEWQFRRMIAAGRTSGSPAVAPDGIPNVNYA